MHSKRMNRLASDKRAKVISGLVEGSAAVAGGPCAPPGGLSGCATPANRTTGTLSIRYATAGTAATTVSDCGPPLPDPPAGLDDNFEAPGVVSVVVVPDGPQPPPAVRPSLVELVPTPSFLRAVCVQLDQHRLVTTDRKSTRLN